MRKILIVEDDIGYMEVTFLKLYYLQQFDTKKYVIIKANDGASGLHIAKKELPDLIISHLNMTNLNGYEMLAVLRENPETKNIPCIMLINQDIEESTEKSKELDIFAFIKKPFETKDLMSIVSNIFNHNDQ